MGYTANDLRPGHVIDHDGDLWICMEAVHKTPGNKRAFVQAKLRNVKEGHQKEYKLSSTEGLERVSLIEKEMQFLYNDEAGYHFMDMESFDQIALSEGMVDTAKNYILPEAMVKVTFHEGTPIGLKLPQTMDFKIIEAEPNLKTATATATYKNATIETGVNIKVPPFIEAGEVVTINTETGDYLTRAKK